MPRAVARRDSASMFPNVDRWKTRIRRRSNADARSVEPSARGDSLGQQAYATLVTNEEYGRGALALARSLRIAAPRRPLVVLATAEAEHLDELEREGCRIVPVRQPALSDEFRIRHSREALHRAAPFNKGNKPAFHDPVDNFCKLELWKLDDYEKIVFLDADSLVVKPIDMLFGFPGIRRRAEPLRDACRFPPAEFRRLRRRAEPRHLRPAGRAARPCRASSGGAPTRRFWRRSSPTGTSFPTPSTRCSTSTSTCRSCGCGRASASCTTSTRSRGRRRTRSGICCSR